MIKKWRHVHTQRLLSPGETVFLCVLPCKSQCFGTSPSCAHVFKRTYSHESLLEVKRSSPSELNLVRRQKLRVCSLLRTLAPPRIPTSPEMEAPQVERQAAEEGEMRRYPCKASGERTQTSHPHHDFCKHTLSGQ